MACIVKVGFFFCSDEVGVVKVGSLPKALRARQLNRKTSVF